MPDDEWFILIHLLTEQSCLPVSFQSVGILIGTDEANIVILGDILAKVLFYIVIKNDTFLELRAYILTTGCTVIQSFFDHTRPDRATLVNYFWMVFHTAITDDILRLDAKTKVFEPPVAQLPLVGRLQLDIGFECQAQVTAVSTTGQDWIHSHTIQLAGSLEGGFTSGQSGAAPTP